MILRTLRETARSVCLRRYSRQAAEKAQQSADGLLMDDGSGFRLPYIHRYTAEGPHGPHAVFVATPGVPPPPGGYPVLYMLDGNAWIASAAEALHFQARFARESAIEPFIIVAVGYPGDDPINMGRRAYDLLPKHRSPKLGAKFMQGAPWHQPGGADAFLDFLSGPLRRAVAARYPVNPGRRILWGHSFGGFFALHALLTAPHVFDGYAALSPSLWWDDGRLTKEADELIGRLPGDTDASVLIAVGGNETPDRPAISERMIADAESLSKNLSANGPPGLHVEYRLLDGETHQSVPVAAHSRVFRFASRVAARPETTPS
ncbi:hypothetical protein FHS78_003288 [Parvibaculum indicum]|uniref:alpha/beta hydrolase n=1 Tax=Parvibaculum indicum TaxID=562969 RepID=UPI001422C93A|nr:alpha/beta hydrolase-fold protein [Parvibaculum indicum]NIJ42980.1 hypothetical protein [Parvibaculum indicum]